MKTNKRNFWILTLTTLLITLGFSAGLAQNVPIPESDGNYETLKAKSLSHLRTTNLGSSSDLKVKKIERDGLDMIHTRVQQTVDNIPVWTGEAIVHLKSNQSLFKVTDNLVKHIDVDTTPIIDSKDASERAVTLYGCRDCLTAVSKVDMWVKRHEGFDRLVYRVQMSRLDGSKEESMPVYFIDAHTSELVWKYDNLQHQSVNGTGISLYSGTRTIKTSRVNGPCKAIAYPHEQRAAFKSMHDSKETGNSAQAEPRPGPTIQPYYACYYLEDIDRQVGTFNDDLSSNPPRFIDSNNYWSSATQKAGVDAHWGMEKTFDYYLIKFSRNGINGFGGPSLYSSKVGSEPLITSIVHVGTNYNNATWNGTYMRFGDGDGTVFSPLVSVDVVGHEWTHGVTQFTAGLIYSGQSGALNESMSDVFGNMVERYAKGASANNWLVGEEITTPGTPGDALRNMADPHTAYSFQYDHYDETPFPGGGGCGVHTCSGVSNKAFYLVSQGGTHHYSGLSVSGIGADKAEKIWYIALSSYMTSGTTFSQARQATLDAAEALHGFFSTERQTVAEAWEACGVL